MTDSTHTSQDRARDVRRWTEATPLRNEPHWGQEGGESLADLRKRLLHLYAPVHRQYGIFPALWASRGTVGPGQNGFFVQFEWVPPGYTGRGLEAFAEWLYGQDPGCHNPQAVSLLGWLWVDTQDPIQEDPLGVISLLPRVPRDPSLPTPRVQVLKASDLVLHGITEGLKNALDRGSASWPTPSLTLTLDHIWVRPELRNQGHGTALMEATCQYLAVCKAHPPQVAKQGLALTIAGELLSRGGVRAFERLQRFFQSPEANSAWRLGELRDASTRGEDA